MEGGGWDLGTCCYANRLALGVLTGYKEIPLGNVAKGWLVPPSERSHQWGFVLQTLAFPRGGYRKCDKHPTPVARGLYLSPWTEALHALTCSSFCILPLLPPWLFCKHCCSSWGWWRPAGCLSVLYRRQQVPWDTQQTATCWNVPVVELIGSCELNLLNFSQVSHWLVSGWKERCPVKVGIEDKIERASGIVRAAKT